MDDFSKRRKVLSVIVILVTIVCSYICYSANKPNGYEVFIGGTPIAYVKDITVFNNVKTDVENDLKKRFGNIKIKTTKSRVEVDNTLVTSEKDIKENLVNENDMQITAVSMLSDNKEIAIIANETEGKAVEDYLKKYYISKANLKNVSSSKIINKITYVKKKVNLKDVEEVQQAAVNIINKNSKTPILTVEIKGTSLSKAQKAVTIDNSNIIGESKLNGAKPANASTLAVFSTPVSGVITSSFGARWGKMHEGVDIGAAMGTPIYAAMDGVVSYAKWEEGYGNTIKIQHGGKLETLYGHCSKIEVKVGQKVVSGQEIGKVGSTGHSTGPHLHFEVRINNVAVEPTKYLKQKLQVLYK